MVLFRIRQRIMQIQGICRKFLAEKRIGKALKAGIPGGEKPVFQKEKGEKGKSAAEFFGRAVGKIFSRRCLFIHRYSLQSMKDQNGDMHFP